MTAAVFSYEAREISFTPGAFIGTMKMQAYCLSWTGIRPLWATKVAWVSAEPVATTLAPLTTMPLSFSATTWTQTSARSWIGRSRSTGGWMMAWLRKRTCSWACLYQARALASNGL